MVTLCNMLSQTYTTEYRVQCTNIAHHRNYREIALTLICCIVRSGTFRNSGIIIKTINRVRYSHLFWFFCKRMSELCRNVAMIFNVDMIDLFKQFKHKLRIALLWDDDLNQVEPRTGFLNVKTNKVCRCFASFSSEWEPFTHGITALIHHSDVKIQTVHCVHVLWRNDAKIFRRGSSLVIAVVVIPHTSSTEFTMSVRGDGERMWPLKHFKPPQTLLPTYQLAHLPLHHPKYSPPRHPQPLTYQISSTGPNILILFIEVFVSFVYMYICAST